MKIKPEEEEKAREAKTLVVSENLRKQAIKIFNTTNVNKKKIPSSDKQIITKQPKVKATTEFPQRSSTSIRNDKNHRLRVGVEFSELVRGAKSMSSFDVSPPDRK